MDKLAIRKLMLTFGEQAKALLEKERTLLPVVYAFISEDENMFAIPVGYSTDDQKKQALDVVAKVLTAYDVKFYIAIVSNMIRRSGEKQETVSIIYSSPDQKVFIYYKFKRDLNGDIYFLDSPVENNNYVEKSTGSGSFFNLLELHSGMDEEDKYHTRQLMPLIPEEDLGNKMIH